MGSSDYLPVEIRHRRQINIELHETEQEKTFTNKDSGFQEHNTDTTKMPRTPRLAQRRITSTPPHPYDRMVITSMTYHLYHLHQDTSSKIDSHLFKQARQTQDFRDVGDNPASSK